MTPHPDRSAATLAQCPALRAAAGPGPFDPPGAGSADAGVDVGLLAFAAASALATRGNEAARARLAGIDSPDLRAGTVQDGTARGVMVAYEEAISLCAPPDAGAGDGDDTDEQTVFGAAELRRKRDLLVASAGARVRFSRRGGLLLVDRRHDLHAEDCLRFEDRGDAGTLDGFEAVPGERPRLFSPAFLKPALFEQGPRRDRLRLEGRLGRGAKGYACQLELEGRKDEPAIRLRVAVHNIHPDHRLRIRWRGVQRRHLAHRGTPAWEDVRAGGHAFLAATLVRACGRMRVGASVVAVPAAQCIGWIQHEFLLGGADAVEATWARP